MTYVEASAFLRPCSMYVDHGSSKPVRTQGHHWRPEYLQQRLWGEVRIKDIIWLCGTCHDSIHAWLDWLFGEAYQPPTPPARLKAEAERVFKWYTSQRAS